MDDLDYEAGPSGLRGVQSGAISAHVHGQNGYPESVKQFEAPVTREGWANVTETMNVYDEGMVSGWKEEIDTLLVFAGLFSAILTVFNIEGYKSLQPDEGELTVLLLAQIFAQLNNSVTNPAIFNSAQDFKAPPSAVRINVVWFTSLVFSLVAAFLGILVKQWLRKYIGSVSSNPREAARVRQHRYNGLVKWGVIKIIGWLPVLLEAALVLFFVGLVNFLWALHQTVAAIVSAFIWISLIFFILTTFAAVFSTNCPYKSPQSFGVCNMLWKMFGHNMLLNFDFRFWKTSAYDRKPPETWLGRDIMEVQHHGPRLDISALSWVNHIFWKDDLLDKVVPCVSDLGSQEAVGLIIEFIFSGADCSREELLSEIPNDRALHTPLDQHCRALFAKFAESVGSRNVERIIQAFTDVLPTGPWPDQTLSDGDLTPVRTLNILHALFLGAETCLDPQHGGVQLKEQLYHRLTQTILDRVHPFKSPRSHVSDEARNFLIALGGYGCHKKYSPQDNVIQCALDAYARKDYELFLSATAASLPPLVGSLYTLPVDHSIRMNLDKLLECMGEYLNNALYGHSNAFSPIVQTSWVDGALLLAEEERHPWAALQNVLVALTNALENKLLPRCKPLHGYRLKVLAGQSMP